MKFLPAFVIAGGKRVQNATERRFHYDWSSVNLTKCRMTRSNTACRVRVSEINRFIQTVDRLLMIAKFLLTCDSDPFRSNLVVSTICSFDSVVKFKETILISRQLISFCFSETVEVCADCSSFLTSVTSHSFVLFLCHFLSV